MCRTVVMVLRSGGDFSMQDVELLVNHIQNKWKSTERPRIICLYDKASQVYNLGNFEIHPLTNQHPGTWSRIMLYAPEMEQFKPFLYLDLDTAVIQSLENIFNVVQDKNDFITLEDFYQKGQIATGLVWFPKDSKKTQTVWKEFKGVKGNRMDYFLRNVVKADKYWQQLTKTIYDFKPQRSVPMQELPKDANIVCLHGKPRMFDAAQYIKWVKYYTRYIL